MSAPGTGTQVTKPLLLKGKPVTERIYEQVQDKVQHLNAQGIEPCLATILVGNDPASKTYVRMKTNACEQVGVRSLGINLPAGTTTSELVERIEELNKDDSVHGILLQHPVPSHIDERLAFDTIDPAKDVDGVTTLSFGRMAFKLAGFASCTPGAIIRILDHYQQEIEGRKAVVVGRSPILGKPVAMLLLNRNATVSICHSRTQDLAAEVATADLVVAACGQPELVRGEWIKPGAVVIDAGYNEGNIGDVDFEGAAGRASAITPVPGGVGPVTIATLVQQTVRAATLAN